MNVINEVSNQELKLRYLREKEETNATLILAFEGRVSRTNTGILLDIDQPFIQHELLAKPAFWKRVIFDLRELDYVNSTGAAAIVALHRIVSRTFERTIMLVMRDSIAMIALQSIGFMRIGEKYIVWDDYEAALNF